MKNCPRCLATYPDEYSVCPKDGARLTGASLWAPGSIIRDKYKILGKIGEGGMAAVYRAQHLLLNEWRALKVIGWDLARDQLFVQRFKNEAIITRKLQHPNAVRVDDLDIAEDGRPFIAMELVEGENLKSLMLRTGPLAISQVLGIAQQVCEALEAAHNLGLVHRDIKPDNIVLVPQPDGPPRVKILDFGIARLKEATPVAGRLGVTLTETGVVIGTPEYMSPEQAMGKRGDELDGRSDLYSLGIVMYRMLTGALPFKADTTVEMILHHIQTVPKPPQTLKPELGIPDAVSKLVMRALEKDRGKRFPSASSMTGAIRQAQESLTLVGRPAVMASAGLLTPRPAPASPAAPEPVALPRASVPSVPVRPIPGQPERKGFPFLRILLGVILVALVVWYVAGRRAREPAQPSAPAQTITAPAEAPAPSVDDSTSIPAETPAGEMGESRRVAPEQAGEPAAGQPLPASSVPQPVQPEEAIREQPTGAGHVEATPTRQEVVRQLEEKATRQFARGEYVQAAKTFRNILAIDPDNQRARTSLRLCLQRLKRARPQRGRPRP